MVAFITLYNVFLTSLSQLQLCSLPFLYDICLCVCVADTKNSVRDSPIYASQAQSVNVQKYTVVELNNRSLIFLLMVQKSNS